MNVASILQESLNCAFHFMLVTQVSLRPTDAAENAGRPALTPELLAATGARYSRSNQGLQSIIDKIDPDNLDASVDGIFKMLDYGHQSIADMAPVAIFMDGISLHLAYFVWSLCPTAAGQESSTRYINYAGMQDLNAVENEEWRAAMAQAVRALRARLRNLDARGAPISHAHAHSASSPRRS